LKLNSLKAKQRASNANSLLQRNKQTSRQQNTGKFSKVLRLISKLHFCIKEQIQLRGKKPTPFKRRCLWNSVCNAHQWKYICKKDRNSIQRKCIALYLFMHIFSCWVYAIAVTE